MCQIQILGLTPGARLAQVNYVQITILTGVNRVEFQFHRGYNIQDPAGFVNGITGKRLWAHLTEFFNLTSPPKNSCQKAHSGERMGLLVWVSFF